jgi:hypothetical protein
MKFDLVSDLHIDVWGKSGELDWLVDQQSDILVIAGDTSDYIDQTCEYVSRLGYYYSTIIIVDGNHEHQTRMEDLDNSIQDWSRCINQTRAIYLGSRQPIINGCQFIGINGWWSFDFGRPNVSREQSIACSLRNAGITELMIEYQQKQGLLDAAFLSRSMIAAQYDPNVKSIVVVTHSLPHPSCISWNTYPPDSEMTGLYGNTNYQWTLDSDVKNKLVYWVFGHNHDRKTVLYKQARFHSNPRGRPEDWNRRNYPPIVLEVPER